VIGTPSLPRGANAAPAATKPKPTATPARDFDVVQRKGGLFGFLLLCAFSEFAVVPLIVDADAHRLVAVGKVVVAAAEK
jgi:hypothetical protein